jgi:hypothetical protein
LELTTAEVVGELRNHATRRSGSGAFRTSLEARSVVEKNSPRNPNYIYKQRQQRKQNKNQSNIVRNSLSQSRKQYNSIYSSPACAPLSKAIEPTKPALSEHHFNCGFQGNVSEWR